MDIQPANPRHAVVAGRFYPEKPESLTREISRLFAGIGYSNEAPAGKSLKAIIAPHAGYIFSGEIAATAFSLLRPLRGTIHRVVLLGPTHYTAVRGLALPANDAFATPLGAVPIDQEAAMAISKLPQVVLSDMAHTREHSLEVEIPFLQYALSDFSLLPLAVGKVSPSAVAEVLECLWGGKETLIVASTDLSHYLSYEDAKHIDAKTAQQILDLDPMINHYQACGAIPVNGLLLAARKHGLQPRQLDLRNSGDTAGDRDRVVGYGAFAFFENNTGVEHHDH